MVSLQMTAGTAMVVIRGDLDLGTLPALTAQLRPVLDGRPERLVFDMTQVGFIDCAAARLIASTAAALPSGRRPVLRSPGPLVRRLLDLSGLADHLDIEPGQGPQNQRSRWSQ